MEWFFLAALIVFAASNIVSFYIGSKVSRGESIRESINLSGISKPHNYMRPEEYEITYEEEQTEGAQEPFNYIRPEDGEY